MSYPIKFCKSYLVITIWTKEKALWLFLGILEGPKQQVLSDAGACHVYYDIYK